jgi:hypothetical protein
MWGLLVADGGSWWMNERLLEVFFLEWCCGNGEGEMLVVV